MKNPNPSQESMREANYRFKKGKCNIFPITPVNEIWLPIIAFPELQDWYYISSYGRVYSRLYDCIVRTRHVGRGYLIVTLRRKNNTPVDILVHRLVMMTFNPIPNPEEMQVNHINGIKTNNGLANLEWTTNSENMIHAYNHGLYKKGEDASFSVLTNNQVELICEALEKQYSNAEICNYAAIPYNKRYVSMVEQIKSRHNWKQISCKYNF